MGLFRPFRSLGGWDIGFLLSVFDSFRPPPFQIQASGRLDELARGLSNNIYYLSVVLLLDMGEERRVTEIRFPAGTGVLPGMLGDYLGLLGRVYLLKGQLTIHI